jgi:hypothetical protein
MEHTATQQPDRTHRRQWFATALRYTLLGGLTLLSGHLLLKSRRPECRRVACQQCGAWGSCGLPLAIETRRKEEGDSHLLCEAPEGPSRQKVTVTFFRRKRRG